MLQSLRCAPLLLRSTLAPRSYTARTMSTGVASNVPAKMKAIRIHKTGGPEVLVLDEVPVPKPGPDDVLIKNEWAGVNYIDTYFRSGLYDVALPFTLGSESSGSVVAVGDNVSDIKVGDRVGSYTRLGSYCEYVAAPRARTAKLPDSVDTKAASTLILQGLTAWGLVQEEYAVKKGDWILVHAAAGGVGILVCQMASHLGGRVIATVSTEEKAKLAKENGAEETILYTKEDFAERVMEITGGKGAKAIYDGVGKTTWEGDFKCIARKGHLVTFGNASGAVPEFAPLKLSPKNIKLSRPTLNNTVGIQEEMDTYSEQLFDLVAKGHVKPHIFNQYPFSVEGLQKAHADLTGRGSTGKLLIKFES